MHHHPKRRTKPTSPGGFSLLELVLAIALSVGTLAPALALLRDGMSVSRANDQRLLLINYATQKLEERMAVVAANWTEGTAAGDLSAEGFPTIRYTADSSDDPSEGGIENRLMHVRVTTYADQDGSNSLGGGEPQCTFRTKIANLNSYVTQANN
jgi:type II secretory pathway pseudopilin PulG